jgi:hypothetical protein
MKKINYNDLNSKQQENYNFHKVAAVLADYGFTSIRLSDDWQGADFIAQHIDGQTFLKVQLKGRRMSFAKKYIGKEIYICFVTDEGVYLYPHDLLLNKIERKISDKTWLAKGTWSTPKLSKYFKTLLKTYML